MVFYEGECWPGEHNAIIDRKTWDLAQSFLRANAPIKKLVRTRSSEAALNGIIRCGHCNSAMKLVKSHRWGREYRYYYCIRDQRRDVSTCPIKEIPAGEIEEMVCKQLTPVLKSPEIVAAVSRQTGIRPTDIMNKFDDGFWNELTPTEKQRLMQIMVEHVTVNEDGVMIVFRTENIKSIQEANIEQNP